MSSCEELPVLPPGVRPPSHQVAGHFYGQGKTKLGFLQAEDGTLMKPVQCPPRGQRELNFYQTVFDSTCSDPVLQELRPLLPTYLGTSSLAEQPGVTYFQLEDITRKFAHPCIMDVKIGPITWDPDADEAKIKSEKSKYPPVEKTGFQIIGIKLSDHEGTFKHIHRDFLRSLDAEELLHKGLGAFFTQNGELQRDIIQAAIARVTAIEKWFLSQQEYAFYASSLLIVYEASSRGQQQGDSSMQHKGDSSMQNEVLVTNYISSGTTDSAHTNGCSNYTTGDCDQNCDINNTQDHQDNTIISHNPSESKVNDVSSINSCDVSSVERGPASDNLDIRMIDFAHVFPTQETDENYLKGIRGLKLYLNRLLLQCQSM